MFRATQLIQTLAPRVTLRRHIQASRERGRRYSHAPQALCSTGALLYSSRDRAIAPRMQRGCSVAGAMAAAFIQLLLPFSTFFFVLSYCCLHNVEQQVDRKVMFLFCNAILLFIARDSCLLGLQKEQPALESIESVDRGSSSAPHPQAPRTEEKSGAATRGDEVAAEGVGSLDLAAGEAMSLENAADEEESADAETDELHQKIEEFIERVKRQRRMEALQLVPV